MRVLPVSLTLDRASQSILLATGSIPVVGSSRNTMGGSPIRAMAVLNFLLLPPLLISESEGQTMTVRMSRT